MVFYDDLGRVVQMHSLFLVLPSVNLEPPHPPQCTLLNKTKAVPAPHPLDGTMKPGIFALFAVIALATTSLAGPIAMGLCQTACNAGYVFCVAEAGFVAGQYTVAAPLNASAQLTRKAHSPLDSECHSASLPAPRSRAPVWLLVYRSWPFRPREIDLNPYASASSEKRFPADATR